MNPIPTIPMEDCEIVDCPQNVNMGKCFLSQYDPAPIVPSTCCHRKFKRKMAEGKAA